MDPVFGVMLDVVRIVSFQARVADAEARRVERDRALASTGTATTEEPDLDVSRAAKGQATQLSRWFRLSFMPR